MSSKRKRHAGEERNGLKHRRTDQASAPEASSNATGSEATPEAPPANGNSPEKSPSKAEQKELKRKLKQLRTDGSETEEKESKEEKKRRKAERKAAKALLKGNVDGSTEASTPIDTDAADGAEAPSETASKAERKAEKKRLKDTKKAAKQTNGTAPATNGHGTARAANGASAGSAKAFLEANSIAFDDPSRSTQCVPIDSFSKLPPAAVEIIAPFQRFEKPTPIQAASWHAAFEGRDVVGVAETGSGKTLAFGVPLINHILAKNPAKKGVSALVVSPTRELAVQIQEQISVLAKPHKLHSVCIYGGASKDAQRAELKRASIIVATPGRLNDFLEEGAASLSGATYVVLDEADRMLDKGFEEAIRTILRATPSSGRQTLMFTATWPQSVRDLAATFMRDPVRITIGTDASGSLRANTRITQRIEVVDPTQKEGRLLQLLREHQSGANKNARVLVFCLYKKEATRIEAMLHRRGLRVAGIHGDLSQERRTASLEGFKAGTTPLLVATDVAARGLDIPDVRLVLNVTFPLTVEDYVHRIGRTGRAGAEGLAITLFTDHDKALAGGLVNVLKAAGQPVPEDLMKFGTAVKKKAHDSYGAFYRAPEDGDKKATKITFDD